MINRNESLVEKESQWYRYRFPYSNAVNVSYAQQLLKLRSYVHVCFSHKKRFIDLAHHVVRNITPQRSRNYMNKMRWLLANKGCSLQVYSIFPST